MMTTYAIRHADTGKLATMTWHRDRVPFKTENRVIAEDKARDLGDNWQVIDESEV
jgi:hypothetical protein